MSEGWKQSRTFAVGGLIQVGYAPQSDYLLVLSHQGRGVFDCISGQKLARDSNDPFDELGFTVEGIGPLAGQKIQTAGLLGGSLLENTDDGWKLFDRKEEFRQIFLKHQAQTNEESILVGDDKICELRAFGFSSTGKSFVVATSCDVVFYARNR